LAGSVRAFLVVRPASPDLVSVWTGSVRTLQGAVERCRF